MSFIPKTLLETESPVSGKIRVIQDGKERRLVIGSLVQSINADAPDVNERIWGKIAQSATPKQSELATGQERKVKNCLILGLGGGTIAHLLTKKFGPIPIDAVEIDPTIVEIGKKFFDLDRLSNLNIIIADAINFVRQQFNHVAMKQYDLVIVDLYCGRDYPPAAESPSFFAGLTRLTNPKGWIVFNRISAEEDLEFEERLKQTFGGFRKKIVPSKFGGENLIYTCSPNLSKQLATERR